MKRRVLFVVLAVSLWPIRANELSGGSHDRLISSPPKPEYLESAALVRSLAKLERRRYRSENQGILVETLDGRRVLAEFNANGAFNPASVMKVATSFMALAMLGPEYRFETSVFGDSELQAQTKSLPGNLYVVSDGNPVFCRKDATAMARSLVRRGLRRVEGDLVVVGPFRLDERYTTLRSAEQLRRALTRSGISIKGRSQLLDSSLIARDSKVLFLSQTSDPLREILWQQNAHSVNEIADRLGDLLGGPTVVQQFLLDNCGIEPHEVYVDRPSGLEYNRMTARAGVKMLRALYYWLEERGMKMQDVMPVAGLDEGTLYGRFRDPDFRGGILGKTGTNPSKDGGVSSLVGLVYLRDHGPVLYAIFNSHGSVNTYRRWQDNFLKDLIEENGGLAETLAPHEDLAGLSSSWTPSEYWGSLSQEPERRRVLKKSKAQPRRYARTSRKSYRRRAS